MTNLALNSNCSIKRNSEEIKENLRKKLDGDVNYAVMDLKNIIEYQ